MVRLGEVISAIESSWRTKSLRLEMHGRDHQWRYWQSGSFRRLETDPGDQVQISRGEVCWRSSPEEGVIELRNTSMSFGPPEAVVDLRGFLAGELTAAEEDEVAGRRAVRLIVKPRAGLPTYLAQMFQKPEAEVWVDIERGVGLKTSHAEVTAIAFDEPLNDELFQAPGAVNRPEAPVRIAPHEGTRLTTEEAIREAPFPLMAPTKLPAGTRLVTWMMWDFPNVKWMGAMYLVEPGPYCAISLHLSTQSGPDGPDTKWTDLEVGGKLVKVSRDEKNPLAPSWARTERDGVIISLQSALPPEMLAEIAASVERL